MIKLLAIFLTDAWNWTNRTSQFHRSGSTPRKLVRKKKKGIIEIENMNCTRCMISVKISTMSWTESEAEVVTSKRNSRSDETYAHKEGATKRWLCIFWRASNKINRRNEKIVLLVEEGSARRRLRNRSARRWCRREVGKLKLKKRSIRLSESETPSSTTLLKMLRTMTASPFPAISLQLFNSGN